MNIFFRSKFLLILLGGLWGCSEQVDAQQHGNAADFPTKEQLSKMSAPGYKPPPLAWRECLGRIAFELPYQVEWATSRSFRYLEDLNHTFSSNLFSQGDEISVGNVKIGVIHPLTRESKAELLDSLPDRRVSRLKKALERSQLRLRELEKANDLSERGGHSIHLEEAEARSLEKSISKINATSIATELPETYIYSSRSAEDGGQSVIWAYIFNGNTGYIISSKASIDQIFTVEKHVRDVLGFIQSFRPRTPGEVPEEPGVCIPFGFVKDNGDTAVNIKMSIRFSDAPGVIYTVHTGNVEGHTMKTTLLNAVVAASVGLPIFGDSIEIRRYITDRIGPKPVKIGGVVGEQGGVALKIKKSSEDSYEAYNVYSGYSGRLGTMAMPYMIVELRSFTKRQVPELKANPPTFKQSRERLDFLLKGMRLRETIPKMSELR